VSSFVKKDPVIGAATQPAAMESSKAARIDSLRIDATDRAGGGLSRWLGRFVRFVLVLAVLAGCGYAASRYYGIKQVPRSLDEARMQLAALWKPDASRQLAGLLPPEIDGVRIGTESEVEVALSLSGQIVPKLQVRVGPRIPGTIISVPVEVGTRVKKGDTLAKLDETSYWAEYEQAKAAQALAEANLLEKQHGALIEEIEEARAHLDEVKTQLELKRRELERRVRANRSLNGVITASEVDTAGSEVRRLEAQVNSLAQKLRMIEKGTRPERIAAAQADVEQARATTNKAKYFFENTSIVAPIAGTVLSKQTEVGEIVRPDVLLSDMFLLADLTQLEAQVDVQERDLHRVALGQPCRVVPDAYPDRTYQARLRRIEPQINRQRAVVEVRAFVTNPDDFLRPHMNCRVEFLNSTDRKSDAQRSIRVPRRSVVKQGKESVVFVSRDDKAWRRVVVPVDEEGDSIGIRGDLKSGDVVLAPRDQILVDGQPVRVRIQ